MIHPAPKPEPREKKPRKRLQSKTRLQVKTPLVKVNVEATKKRAKRHKKQWASAHDQAVRAAAFERARNQCEFIYVPSCPQFTPFRCGIMNDADMPLEAHHLRYPKSRPLAVTDLEILCRYHHGLVEQTQFSYRRHGKVG